MSSALPPIRQTSPAAERNKGPILAELQRILPAEGHALEIAAGTGQHAAHFAQHLPGWRWQPTDPDASALSSIAAWRIQAGAPGLQSPMHLDVLADPWPVTGPFDAIYCANMLHISPWRCCAALMHGAARHLNATGQLLTYGPYFVAGEAPAPGNLAFDADLRQRHPEWGVRALADVVATAQTAGLVLHERVALPANNCLLVFRRARAAR